MRRQRNVKSLATLGPASSSPEMIRRLFDAGADVFRLNFSHGSHADHRERFDIIRRLEEEYDRPIGILVDLQGPKLRVGRFAEGHVDRKAGAPFRLDLSREPCDHRRAPLPHPEILQALKPGTNLLLDDGRLCLTVATCSDEFCETVVTTGGRLSDRKGVNVPDVVLPRSPLTRKDHEDLRFGLELGVDWVALSFVQRPEDVAEARRIIGTRAAVLVKLEKPQAIDRLQELIDLADAVMVARGDLGVEMPPEDVPSVQKRIIGACRLAGKPAQVAHTLSAAAIVTYTTSGSTALRAARERPEVPILCLTSKLETARRLAIAWGIHCVNTRDVRTFSEMVDKACRIAQREEIAES